MRYLNFEKEKKKVNQSAVINQGVQRRMVFVAIVFFRIFENKWFCLVVAICALVHDVEAIHGLPQFLTAFFKPFLSDSCETEVCETSNRMGITHI